MPSKTDINPETGKQYAVNPSSGVWDDNYWANVVEPKLRAQYGSTSATNTSPVNTQAVLDQQKQQSDETLAKQKAERDTLFANQKKEIGDFTTTYKTASDTNSAAVQEKYGIPTLTSAVNALRSRISELQGNLTGEGAGGYASANQVDRAVNTQYIPKFTNATQALSTSMASANQEFSQLMTPYNLQADFLSDRLAREMTGFSQGQQDELTLLIQQLNAGVQLTRDQIARANELADREAEFSNQLKLLQEQARISDSSAEKQAQLAQKYGNNDRRYITVGSSIYDTQSGNWLKAPNSGGNVANGW